MKIQIIVTTMFQTDFSIVDRMKIVSDVIVANQADMNEINFKKINQGTALLITTKYRGLSRNRNLGIEYIDNDTDYILFADDDLVFVDDYFDIILSEVTLHSEAEALKFNLYDISETRKISMKPITKYQKASRTSVTSCGAWGLLIRRDVLIKCNLRFNEFFGTGTPNYCGEDTIFLQEMINKGIKFYLSPVTIAGIDQTKSSWFEGYNEKFFYVAGMVLAAMYPHIAKLLALRSSCKFFKRSDCHFTFFTVLSNYLKGIKEFNSR